MAVGFKNSLRAWVIFQSAHWVNFRSAPTAAFLCADLAITPETRADHAAYIASWLEVLKGDKRAIFTAASKASAAAEYLQTLALPEQEAA
jgi:antirestriction protein ArdC